MAVARGPHARGELRDGAERCAQLDDVVAAGQARSLQRHAMNAVVIKLQ
jgi:hypothetical protein